MKNELIYVELKTGYGHSGPAWIGKAFFSKSGQSIYFDGVVLKKSQGISGNFYNPDTQEEYWVSGVKKNGTDRHKFGSGKIRIDKSVITEYLDFIQMPELPKNKFIIVELNNIPIKEEYNEFENQKVEENVFDRKILYKNLVDLSDIELADLIDYYKEIDLPSLPKKARRFYKEKMINIGFEIKRRVNKMLKSDNMELRKKLYNALKNNNLV